jgi:molecular chaperone DnaK (HSP70)
MPDIGIDLGTTTTLLASAYLDNSAQLNTRIALFPANIEGTLSTTAIRSVAYVEPGAPALVGVEAESKAKETNDYRYFVRAIKRYMGRSVVIPHVKKSPSEISAIYLSFIIRSAFQKIGFTNNDQITITVPASFTAAQRADTLNALDIAAQEFAAQFVLTPERKQNILISEPTAALLSVINDDLNKAPVSRRFSFDQPTKVLVYDIGGGTLDLTLATIQWRPNSAKTSIADIDIIINDVTRYNQFGGEDFDVVVAHRVAQRLIEENPELGDRELRDDNIMQYRVMLLEYAEQIKRDLNTKIIEAFDDSEKVIEFSTIEPILIGGRPYSILDWQITIQDYLSWVHEYLTYQPQLKNCLHPINLLLQRNKLQRNDVRYCIAVGGMSRFDPLQDALRSFWGSHTQLMVPSNPDQVVAQGAAIYSHLKRVKPQFAIIEPTADVFYVKIEHGFDILYNQSNASDSIYKATTAQESRYLELHIFTGDGFTPPQTIRNVLHTLVPQGNLVIDMGSSQPVGTTVYIQLYFRSTDTSKVPFVKVSLNQMTNIISDTPLRTNQ